MSPELDKQLCSKYPKIFANRHGNMMSTAMCWGFECGDGWYDIVDAACLFIQKHCDSTGDQVKAMQIKEKFGSLRFYIYGGDAYTDDIIDCAERASEVTCEITGKPGRTYGLHDGGWMKTLCEEKAKELGYV